jgi:hypothetical protein
LAAQKLKLETVPCIRLAHLTETQKRAYIIADNKLAEIGGGWDEDLLKLELDEILKEIDGSKIGFDEKELESLNGSALSDNYTRKIDAPVYEPKGEKPELSELIDSTKANELIAAIEQSTAPDEIKAFLIQAAQRHIVFDYGKIAEYYCHASKEIQELMEDSALVIIDFKKALQHGYVKLKESILDALESEDAEDESDE